MSASYAEIGGGNALAVDKQYDGLAFLPIPSIAGQVQDEAMTFPPVSRCYGEPERGRWAIGPDPTLLAMRPTLAQQA